MPPACLKQAFRIVALDRCGNHSRSKRSRSNVPPKYADPRRFFARLASEIFLTSLQTAFLKNLREVSLGPHGLTSTKELSGIVAQDLLLYLGCQSRFLDDFNRVSERPYGRKITA